MHANSGGGVQESAAGLDRVNRAPGQSPGRPGLSRLHTSIPILLDRVPAAEVAGSPQPWTPWPQLAPISAQ